MEDRENTQIEEKLKQLAKEYDIVIPESISPENIKKRIHFEIDCYTENNNPIHLDEIKKLNNTLQKLKTKD